MASSSYSSNYESQRSKKLGVSILKEIIRKIKLDENLIRENNFILHAFLSTFIDEMKRCDFLFNLLFKELYFCGSFYSDLRITKPDEFDINLILKLPFNCTNLEVTLQPQTPSYAKYYLKNHALLLFQYYHVSNLFEGGFLIPEKVCKWLQSVVDKAMINYRPPHQVQGVSVKQSGPARTILLLKQNGQIDVDLVPVFSWMIELPKASLDGRVAAKVGNRLMTFIVPKPYSCTRSQMPVNMQEVKCLWRSHFPTAEDTIIYNLGCVKSIIKLLKLLRDTKTWKSLASYYLKTVVMWMIIENSDPLYWKEDNMAERFIEALKMLAKCLAVKNIPYIFNKKYNLIQKMSDAEALNIHNWLVTGINKIECNRNWIWNAFEMTPSFVNS